MCDSRVICGKHKKKKTSVVAWWGARRERGVGMLWRYPAWMPESSCEISQFQIEKLENEKKSIIEMFGNGSLNFRLMFCFGI